MNSAAAQELTRLFNRITGHAHLRMASVRIDFMGEDGTEISIRPQTPAQAAHYLTLLRDGRTPLFQRAVLFPGQHNIPSPILFTVEGRYTDERVRKEYTVLHACNMRFMEAAQPGQLIYDEMFAQFAGLKYTQGPSLDHFIATLEKAGTNWQAVHFVPQKGAHLKLVHST